MIIGLDMDGVMADFMGAVIEQYNHFTNENITLADIKTYSASKYIKDPHRWQRIIESPGFMRSLKPINGAIEGVETLHKAGHEIIFVSNASNCPTSGHEKREWLKYYFHHIWKIAPLVLTYYKYHVYCDVLVDDNVKNFKNLRDNTKALLWNWSYNKDMQGFDRIYSWAHFLKWVKDNE